MILFKDNRAFIDIDERLNIAVIHIKPIGELYVELTDEWFKKPELPLIHITDIFPSVLCTEAKMIKGYLNALIREHPYMEDEKLYLSILESHVDIMNERYMADPDYRRMNERRLKK